MVAVVVAEDAVVALIVQELGRKAGNSIELATGGREGIGKEATLNKQHISTAFYASCLHIPMMSICLDCASSPNWI